MLECFVEAGGREQLPDLFTPGGICHNSEHRSLVNLCRYNQNKPYIRYIRSRTVTEILTQEYCGFLAVSRTVPAQ